MLNRRNFLNKIMGTGAVLSLPLSKWSLADNLSSQSTAKLPLILCSRGESLGQ